MLSLIIALGASLSYGASDFLAGSQTRRTSLWTVIMISQLSGLGMMLLVVLVRGNGPPTNVLLSSVGAGLFTVVATVAGYQALAVGVMSIVSPIVGLCAAVPIVVGLASGEHPSMLQLTGIGVALGGLVLASLEKSAGNRFASTSRVSVALAIVAALAYGSMMVLYARGAESDPYWSVFFGKSTTTAVFALAFTVMRPRLTLTWPVALRTMAIGVFAVGGNALFSAASTLGYLSVVSVLSALAPVFVVTMAHIFLHERLSPAQQAGVAAALFGVALIAAG